MKNYGFESTELGEATGKGIAPLRDWGEGLAARGRLYPFERVELTTRVHRSPRALGH